MCVERKLSRIEITMRLQAASLACIYQIQMYLRFYPTDVSICSYDYDSRPGLQPLVV